MRIHLQAQLFSNELQQSGTSQNARFSKHFQHPTRFTELKKNVSECAVAYSFNDF